MYDFSNALPSESLSKNIKILLLVNDKNGDVMEEKIISSLDPARFMKSCGWNFKQSWKGTIDVSVWLKAKMRAGGRIYLLLEYQDQASKRTVPVDRCLSQSSESILLNSRVSFSGQGDIQMLRLTIKFENCDANSIVSEELSINPVVAKPIGNKLRVAV